MGFGGLLCVLVPQLSTVQAASEKLFAPLPQLHATTPRGGIKHEQTQGGSGDDAAAPKAAEADAAIVAGNGVLADIWPSKLVRSLFRSPQPPHRLSCGRGRFGWEGAVFTEEDCR